MGENRGSWLACAAYIFFSWSLVAFLIRVWAKYRTKSWALDDYAYLTAFLASLVHVALVAKAINWGYGKALAELQDAPVPQISMILYVAQFFYLISIGLCRIATAMFIGHIIFTKGNVWIARSLAIAGAVWVTGSIIAIAVSGYEHWQTITNDTHLHTAWMGIEISGMVLEFALWISSCHLVWGLQMKLTRRLFILTAFGTRLLLIPLVILRLRYLQPSILNESPTASGIVADIFTEAVLQFSIIACSMTALKPFLAVFDPAHVVGYAGGTSHSSTLASKDRTRERYYRLQNLHPRPQDQQDPSGENAWKPYEGPQAKGGFTSADVTATAAAGASITQPRTSAERGKKASTEHKGKLKRSKTSEEQDESWSVQTDGSEKMIIKRTVEVSIQYNKDGSPGPSN
ncbi:hypothetical protein VHEMI02727 [[Torrubiella] hemipterigena]|uniref:Rhodopsin domain-containing protein n=1 Tax=[Torrubiella] hemipterigena TaxID=1531966 RepID=A0A0A1SQK7_9HYPO|nr:hypothetical protein VHEMI02727 [[Torrubiella] hemipterigena]